MLVSHNISMAISLFLHSLFRKRRRRQIRMMMRGYRYLKKEDRLHIIEDAVQHLRDFQLQIPPKTFSALLWGEASQSAELIVRQRLSSRYIELTQSLLIASSEVDGSVIAPIPKVWRFELQRLGFRLDHFRSSLAWNFYLIKLCCHGLLEALLIIKSFIYAKKKVVAADEDYIYFCHLVANNIPTTAHKSSSNCILSWYSRWPGRRHDITSLRHSVADLPSLSLGSYDLRYQQSPLPGLTNRTEKIDFFLSFLASLFCLLGSLCKRQWWNILIYRESIASLLVRFKTNALAKEYWFHNSHFYPPLWTYELPSKGSKCIYYFYSINCEPFLFRKDGSRPFITPYSIMNWPEYLVWDDCQRGFIRKCCGYLPKVSIVGTINFSDKVVSFPVPRSQKVIAVFDVQPYRNSLYQGFGFANDYYVPDQCIAFFQDIVACAKDLDAKLLIKRKRDIGSALHPLYKKYVDSISSSENIIFVDSGLSAKAVMDCSIGSISMPYTSTAITSREMGIPSVYYVPSVACGVDFSLSHGIQTISGIDSLRSWMNLILPKDLS